MTENFENKTDLTEIENQTENLKIEDLNQNQYNEDEINSTFYDAEIDSLCSDASHLDDFQSDDDEPESIALAASRKSRKSIKQTRHIERVQTLTKDFVPNYSVKKEFTPFELFQSLELQLMQNAKIFEIELTLKYGEENPFPEVFVRNGSEDNSSSTPLAEELPTSPTSSTRKSLSPTFIQNISNFTLPKFSKNSSNNNQNSPIKISRSLDLYHLEKPKLPHGNSSTIEELNLSLNFLTKSINSNYFVSQWKDGLCHYFYKVEEYMKTDEDYETLKLSAFLYRLLKIETSLDWDNINVLPDVVFRNKVVQTWRKYKKNSENSKNLKNSKNSGILKTTSSLFSFSSAKNKESSTNSESNNSPESSPNNNSLLSKNRQYKSKKFKKTIDDLKTQIQTARFIWQNDWRQKCHKNLNPLLLASIMLRILSDVAYFIDHKTLEEYSLYVQFASDHLIETSERIDKMTTKTGIAKIGAGAAGLSAASIGIFGLLLTPATAGMSLALTVGSMSAGLIGGGTSLTSTIVSDKALAEYVRETRNSINKAMRYTICLKEIVTDTGKSFEIVSSMLKDMLKKESVDGKSNPIGQFISQHGLVDGVDGNDSNKKLAAYLRDGAFIGWDIFTGISDIAHLDLAMGLLKALNVGIFQPAVKVAGTNAVKLTSITTDTLTTGADAMSLIVKTTTYSTKIISSVAAAITIFTSINDIMDGKKFVGKHELCTEFQELSEHLLLNKEQVIKTVEEFSKHNVWNREGKKVVAGGGDLMVVNLSKRGERGSREVSGSTDDDDEQCSSSK